MRIAAAVLAACVVVGLGGFFLRLHGAPRGPIVLDDRAAEAGIRFTHRGAPRASLLPEDVGSGAAWGDYDGDGWPDLYLANFCGPFLAAPADLAKRPGGRLYRNNGDGTFADVTAEAGLERAAFDNAALWLDYDGDGACDLALTRYDGVSLYRNRRDGTFEDVTAAAGLGDLDRYFMGMAAADYDGDGRLDLYLCGYVVFDREKARHRPLVTGRPAVWTNPVSYKAERNVLLHNEGNGRFRDVAAAAGVEDARGKSMQALFVDLDGDARPDLFVANDVGTADSLFRNLGNGRFAPESMRAGTHDRRGSMGLAASSQSASDVPDLFVTHWVYEDHALWRNRSKPGQVRFEDTIRGSGLEDKKPPEVGWGVSLEDLDNDGLLDAMWVCGSTIEDEIPLEVLSRPELMPQQARLHAGQSDGKWLDVSERAGGFFRERLDARALACADYDRDGRLDVAAGCNGSDARLLHNGSPGAGHWLSVLPRPAAAAPGARVRVRASDRSWTRWILAGGSYLSSHEPVAHFGMGEASGADELEVRWPGGAVQRFEKLDADRILVVRRETDGVSE